MTTSLTKEWFIFFTLLFVGLFGSAQCPTVNNTNQSFCDIDSLLISDLQANDQGAGIAWFISPSSTNPLSGNTSLINGATYYLDNATGDCGNRIGVTVSIIGPPLGLNFQGVCVEDPAEATLDDLEAFGNDVQWYISSTSNTPLNLTTLLTDGTIYYADQANPQTGCRTSRLPVLVNIGIVPVPVGESVQTFCVGENLIPTVADLNASGNNLWYASVFSALPLDPNTPLVDGDFYYATIIDPPCESINRFEVEVILIEQISAGSDGTLEICTDDNTTFNLFDSLGGTPVSGGIWSPALSSGTGIFEPNIDSEGVYTYTVSNVDSQCPDASANVTVSFIPPPSAGEDGLLDICLDDTSTFDLFDSLGGTPDVGGTWSPALNSGTGVFDPNIDNAGVYTYTVSDPNSVCADASATITVTITTPPSAGIDGSLDICADDNTTFNLFDSLGGTPDANGIWSPALNSGSGIFDPNVDPEGVYTYTVSSANAQCPDASANVTVSFIPPPSAGEDGLLDICLGDTSTFDLFDSLGGTPDVGGTWSPALNSGTGVFDPNIDNAGVYTYTVSSPNSACADASATITVTITTPPSAGIDGSLDICADDNTIFNLFDSLGGTPDANGIWSPALNSGSGIFDPNVDPEGVYTYTVSSANAQCPDASATVTVSFIPPPSAGEDGLLDICLDDTSTFDLFDSLGGTPDVGGTWSPALNSGTGVFDPNIDTAGVYTYTVSSPNSACADASATVTVTITTPPSAGIDGSLDICADDNTTFNLFDSLGGTPDANGIWSPALNSGSGIFDPNVDSEGVYTYTVSSANAQCPDASATVTVSFIPPPSAGEDGLLDICLGDTSTFDLFDSLGGTPDVGGTWSPALNSGTGVFDPNIDNAGVYTYTVPSSDCGPEVSSEVIVTFLQSPDISNLVVIIGDVCEGSDVNVSIEEMSNLENGDYFITYEISGSNSLTNSEIVTATNGVITFVLSSDLFISTGLNIFNLTLFESEVNGCAAVLNPNASESFEIFESTSPVIIDGNSTFCIEDIPPTIEDLTNRLAETNGIEWFASLNSEEPLPMNTLLENGTTYYASITNSNGCTSITRLAVEVALIICIEDIIIPDGFSPNGDGVNDNFNIVNLEELYPNFNLTIYNRYGNKLYAGNINTPKWDGTTTTNRIGGSTVPPGVYFYILEFNDGIRESKQGRVYLNR